MENPDFIVPPPGLFGPPDAPAGADAVDPAPPTGPAASIPALSIPALSIPAFVPTVLGAPPRTGAPTPAVAAWRLSLADGQVITLTGALVLGRAPAPVTRCQATLVSVIDPARSVSKSHALVELVDGAVWVTDLYSTNGVSLVDPHGERLPLDPGLRTALTSPHRLWLGEFTVDVARTEP